jgi:hypothetical protein
MSAESRRCHPERSEGPCDVVHRTTKGNPPRRRCNEVLLSPFAPDLSGANGHCVSPRRSLFLPRSSFALNPPGHLFLFTTLFFDVRHEVQDVETFLDFSVFPRLLVDVDPRVRRFIFEYDTNRLVMGRCHPFYRLSHSYADEMVA